MPPGRAPERASSGCACAGVWAPAAGPMRLRQAPVTPRVRARLRGPQPARTHARPPGRRRLRAPLREPVQRRQPWPQRDGPTSAQPALSPRSGWRSQAESPGSPAERRESRVGPWGPREEPRAQPSPPRPPLRPRRRTRRRPWLSSSRWTRASRRPRRRPSWRLPGSPQARPASLRPHQALPPPRRRPCARPPGARPARRSSPGSASASLSDLLKFSWAASAIPCSPVAAIETCSADRGHGDGERLERALAVVEGLVLAAGVVGDEGNDARSPPRPRRRR